MNNTNPNDTSWMVGVKGISILGIVMYHWFNSFDVGIVTKVSRIGAQGVHLFFILSAFGLYLSVSQQKKIPNWDWIKRRFLKVLVPYYMAVCLVCGSIVLYSITQVNFVQAINKFELNFQSLIATIFLYRGFIERFVFVINDAWWFVITILEFYLIFPILCSFYRRSSRIVFLGSVLSVTFVYQIFYSVGLNSDSLVFAKFFLSFLFAFSLGIYLADLYLKDLQRFHKLTLGWLPFLIGIGFECFGVLLANMGKVGIAINDVFNAIGFSLITYNFYWFFSRCNFFKSSAIFLGKYSMAIFLLHESYINIVFGFLNGKSVVMTIVMFPLYFLFCIVLSMIFQFVFVDKYFKLLK